MTLPNFSALRLGRSPVTQLLLGTCLIGGASACAGSDTGEGDEQPSASAQPTGEKPSGALCASDQRYGSFSLRLSEDRTILDGWVRDKVKPSGVPRELAADGACHLYAPRDLFCTTPCASGMTCAGDDLCVATGMVQSAGTVTVTGLQVPVEVTKNGITGEYGKTILDPYPAFQPGTAIQLSASGDVVSGFTLRGWGVPPLVTSLTTVNVSSGSSVPLSWDTAGVDPEQSEISIWFSVDVHGATTRWIECTVADSGSFELPATLVTELIELGLSGFPRVSITRRSTDSTQLADGSCVDFEVGSELKIPLTVDGLVSCNTDDECPTGQTCNELACE